MNSFEKAYYEQTAVWQWDVSSRRVESNRFRTIIKYIPGDVATLLDAGSGNGGFLKELKDTALPGLSTAVGMERSRVALCSFDSPDKIRGSVASMPLRDRSFDMVTSQEVLEHLPYRDYHLALAEIQRVSKKYILVSVPNSEELENSLSVCPYCHCGFNAAFHIRSFDEQRLRVLFKPLFELKDLTQIGPAIVTRKYPVKFMTLYRAIIKPSPPANAVCPQCGFMMAADSELAPSDKIRLERTPFAHRVIKWAAKIILPKRIKGRRWLLALYQRRSF